MAGQGRHLSSESIERIIHLLRSTEMTISEIAERISISKSTVIAINRRFQVRNYGGMRTRWIQRNAEDAAEQEALLLVKKQSA